MTDIADWYNVLRYVNDRVGQKYSSIKDDDYECCNIKMKVSALKTR